MKLITHFTGLLCLLVFINACGSKTEEKQEEETSSNEEMVENVSSVVGEEVRYSTDSTEMVGYVAYDESIDGTRPGVIIVHEWWGHNDYVRMRADKLAELGYAAIAVDMYGDGKQAEHPGDAGKFAGMVMSNIDMAKERFEAAMKLLKSHPKVDSTKIAAIGYCFGGSVVLTMANAGEDLDAVAAFHSGVQLPIMPNESLKAKVLVCNGGADPMIPPKSVNNFKSAMDSIGADYKYIEYPGATHAFTNKGADSLGQKFDIPLAYNEEADTKSWEELKNLLNDVFN
ncbi:dienelactone hydrolase family protein [Marinigracilibium pacificum]|uniref:Dienelactone hydrolase family protein n=1 Tax=Marinigracilibium pacificum TaxID=2729599 RepID=A0A848J617_9BACT|nr:dienelactone hydrolase family protein [Marinigracilibium pacificum]NMM49960.1 dienelactone hydrolase family protein [Marinigracilibium pacificum]